jgi:signal transduction histidine kinase
MVFPVKVPGPSGGETTLYRLVQEALNNAVKLRKARHVSIRVGGENVCYFVRPERRPEV